LIVLEFVSGDGSEERDKTPLSLTDRETQQKPGKFWIYEQVIRPAFYGIYEVKRASVEVYHLVDGEYQLMPANERGHYSISSLGVELGIWQGYYQNLELPWLRWWDTQGNLLLTGQQRAEQAESQLEQERRRAERLAAQLRAAGIEPEV
jgi:hypothetical protein